jgi:hypothetical protein
MLRSMTAAIHSYAAHNAAAKAAALFSFRSRGRTENRCPLFLADASMLQHEVQHEVQHNGPAIVEYPLQSYI